MANSDPSIPHADHAALVPLGNHAAAPPIVIKRPLTAIGSKKDAVRIHLESSTVSKIHCVIVLNDWGCYVHDLGSRTHTWVNGNKVIDANLSDGDTLQVGRFQFKYVAPHNVAPPTPKTSDEGIQVSTLTDPLSLDKRVVLIGRRPGSDLRLDDKAISNIHAILFECNGMRFARDMGSRTGTWLDGKPVHQEPLYEGAELKIGPSVLTYRKSAVIDADLSDSAPLTLHEALPTPSIGLGSGLPIELDDFAVDDLPRAAEPADEVAVASPFGEVSPADAFPALDLSPVTSAEVSEPGERDIELDDLDALVPLETEGEDALADLRRDWQTPSRVVESAVPSSIEPEPVTDIVTNLTPQPIAEVNAEAIAPADVSDTLAPPIELAADTMLPEAETFDPLADNVTGVPDDLIVHDIAEAPSIELPLNAVDAPPLDFSDLELDLEPLDLESVVPPRTEPPPTEVFPGIAEEIAELAPFSSAHVTPEMPESAEKAIGDDLADFALDLSPVAVSPVAESPAIESGTPDEILSTDISADDHEDIDSLDALVEAALAEEAATQSPKTEAALPSEFEAVEPEAIPDAQALDDSAAFEALMDEALATDATPAGTADAKSLEEQREDSVEPLTALPSVAQTDAVSDNDVKSDSATLDALMDEVLARDEIAEKTQPAELHDVGPEPMGLVDEANIDDVVIKPAPDETLTPAALAPTDSDDSLVESSPQILEPEPEPVSEVDAVNLADDLDAPVEIQDDATALAVDFGLDELDHTDEDDAPHAPASADFQLPKLGLSGAAQDLIAGLGAATFRNSNIDDVEAPQEVLDRAHPDSPFDAQSQLAAHDTPDIHEGPLLHLADSIGGEASIVESDGSFSGTRHSDEVAAASAERAIDPDDDIAAPEGGSLEDLLPQGPPLLGGAFTGLSQGMVIGGSPGLQFNEAPEQEQKQPPRRGPLRVGFGRGQSRPRRSRTTRRSATC